MTSDIRSIAPTTGSDLLGLTVSKIAMKKVVCSVMVRALSIFSANAPEWSLKCCAAPNPVICRSNNPTKFKLVISLRTAKTINYAVPTNLMLRAGKVIE
jgi:hypothetical protein